MTDREWYRAWPPDEEVPLVAARQHELHGVGLPLDPRLDARRTRKDAAAQLLPQGLQLLAEGREGQPVRVRDPGGPGRPAARRADGRAPARRTGSRWRALTAPVTVKEGTFAKGAFVVKLDQPYRNYAVDLLEPQKFPAKTPYTPYDDVSLGAARPLRARREADRRREDRVGRADRRSPRRRRVAGRVSGAGPVFLLKDTGQEALLAARFRLATF